MPRILRNVHVTNFILVAFYSLVLSTGEGIPTSVVIGVSFACWLSALMTWLDGIRGAWNRPAGGRKAFYGAVAWLVFLVLGSLQLLANYTMLPQTRARHRVRKVSEQSAQSAPSTPSNKSLHGTRLLPM
uniref:Uncharacterized protein n=1 Tax=uncultured Armatimonadetes bacterium TaxID=157466 RepID=A0A6J4JRH7_9BACT|nr:hypothetical protein AVDCRST_MAG63-3944 [uncultured Armatimonadetes bacterium]